jgi:hypothetical protein
MIIALISHSNGKITDAVLQHAIRTNNCQIEEEFAPYRRLGAQRMQGD